MVVEAEDEVIGIAHKHHIPVWATCYRQRVADLSKSANGSVPRRPFTGPYFAVRQQKTKGHAVLHRVAFETVP